MSWLDLAAGAWASLPIALRRKLLAAANHTVMIGAVGLIPDDRGRLLLLEHRFRSPYRWGLPGGFLKSGELPADGLRRELLEETGLLVRAGREIFDAEYNLKGGYVSLALEAVIEGGTLGLSSEILSGDFFEAERIPAETYPHHAFVVSRWLQGRRKAE